MAAVSPTTEGTSAQYISFLFSNGLRGMLPTSQLAETINLDLGSIVQIPDLPPAVVGVCGWRGDVLWLVDLSYALRFPPLLAGDYGGAKCNVLRVTVNQQVFGILVAEVQQLIRGDRQDLIPTPPPQIPQEMAAVVAGQLPVTPNETILNINLEALLERLRQPS
ncbi:chemotaxis protein CheW [Synechococcus moorigangaii CMS01]|nr:chemotaxis protein CheW [Synechococcus moorigangaii CMS01]